MAFEFDSVSFKKELRKVYENMGDECLEKRASDRMNLAKRYHISNVAGLYLQFVKPTKLIICDKTIPNHDYFAAPNSLIAKIKQINGLAMLSPNNGLVRNAAYKINDKSFYTKANAILERLHKKQAELEKSRKKKLDHATVVSLKKLFVERLSTYGLQGLIVRLVIFSAQLFKERVLGLFRE